MEKNLHITSPNGIYVSAKPVKTEVQGWQWFCLPNAGWNFSTQPTSLTSSRPGGAKLRRNFAAKEVDQKIAHVDGEDLTLLDLLSLWLNDLWTYICHCKVCG